MKIPVFQLINLGIILVVLVFLIRYLWDLFFGKGYQPSDWENARKAGRISNHLLKLEKNYPDKVRFFTWWFQVDRLKRESISGAFAELGVYKGESAAILHHMDPSREFHLFDTFEGFNKTDLHAEIGEAATYTPDHFADTHISRVLSRISDNSNIHVHKGYFPQTTSDLDDVRFAFVNMDADLYNPTRAGLEFFYPRLMPGGVMFIHDYTYKWEGIKKAVDEFMNTIPENLVLVPDLEGTVMIVKNSSAKQTVENSRETENTRDRKNSN
jgi:O-methyltransferase